MRNLLATTTILASIAFGGAAFAESHAMKNPDVGGAAMFAEKNIIENAVNSADHTTLVAAVKAAGLVETLSGPGPFTVFAPVNAAFAALPAGTVETLLKPENKAMLSKILTCHVVAADVMSDAIQGMIADDNGAHPVPTVGGCTLMAKMDGDMITLTDETGGVATVTIADVKQSNGVIHVIDKVLLPSPDQAKADTMEKSDNPMVGGAAMFASKDIIDNAVNSADHTTLVAAVKAAGLVDTLKGPGPFTVFAPTNAAFAALPDGTVETLLMPENKAMLTKILTSHVVAGKWSANDIVTAAKSSSDGFYHFSAVSGDALSAKVTPSGDVYIFDESGNASKVTIANVNQSNGVIHVIEDVLLPK